MFTGHSTQKCDVAVGAEISAPLRLPPKKFSTRIASLSIASPLFQFLLPVLLIHPVSIRLLTSISFLRKTSHALCEHQTHTLTTL